MDFGCCMCIQWKKNFHLCSETNWLSYQHQKYFAYKTKESFFFRLLSKHEVTLSSSVLTLFLWLGSLGSFEWSKLKSRYKKLTLPQFVLPGWIRTHEHCVKSEYLHHCQVCVSLYEIFQTICNKNKLYGSKHLVQREVWSLGKL